MIILVFFNELLERFLVDLRMIDGVTRELAMALLLQVLLVEVVDGCPHATRVRYLVHVLLAIAVLIDRLVRFETLALTSQRGAIGHLRRRHAVCKRRSQRVRLCRRGSLLAAGGFFDCGVCVDIVRR